MPNKLLCEAAEIAALYADWRDIAYDSDVSNHPKSYHIAWDKYCRAISNNQKAYKLFRKVFSSHAWSRYEDLPSILMTEAYRS
jgi:hypothetical protein